MACEKTMPLIFQINRFESFEIKYIELNAFYFFDPKNKKGFFLVLKLLKPQRIDYFSWCTTT